MRKSRAKPARPLNGHWKTSNRTITVSRPIFRPNLLNRETSMATKRQSQQTAAQLMRTGQIRSTQIGKLWKTKLVWIQEYIERSTKGPTDKKK